jgi:hypothetical protein
MTQVEDIEVEKRHRDLEQDVADLVDKYLRIVEWDVPEPDESRVRRRIIAEIRQALDRLEE